MILFQDDNDGFPVRLTYDDTPNTAFPFRFEQFQNRERAIAKDTVWLTEKAMLKLKAALNRA